MNPNLTQLHVGRGTTRGALTVFPIWSETAAPARYSTRTDVVRVAERTEGPQVGSLMVTNPTPVPVLLLEGQLLEGGWQHRMVARSVLLGAGDELPLDVVCVEQGRWTGGRTHAARGRRASSRVRSGLRSANPQGEVWSRVGEYEARYGANATASYVAHSDRAARDVARMTEGLRPFPGQVGIVVGIAGQPVAAEVFGSPRTLAEQFAAIVAAAAMDALGRPPVETPSRRARRFVDRAARVTTVPEARAGLAVNARGRDQYADVSALVWDEQEIHALLTNPRHELNLAHA